VCVGHVIHLVRVLIERSNIYMLSALLSPDYIYTGCVNDVRIGFVNYALLRKHMKSRVYVRHLPPEGYKNHSVKFAVVFQENILFCPFFASSYLNRDSVVIYRFFGG